MLSGEIFFNGKSNLEMNLKLNKYPVIPLTSEEFSEEKVDGKNGTLISSKGTYPDKRVTFEFTLISDAIENNLELIRAWLTDYTDNKLFYGRSDRVYRVKKVILGNFEQEFLTFGLVNVDFIFEAYQMEPTKTQYTITSNNFSFNYSGTAPADNIIEIFGNGNIQLTINNETIQILNVVDYVVLDSDLLEARDKNGLSKDFDTTGDYVTFEKGINSISYSGNVNKIIVTYNTMYK